MAAFSHFTYWLSDGLFIVTDLQGADNLLSDPAIHSENKKLFAERTNRKQEGINEFFVGQHKYCNHQICDELFKADRPDTEAKLVDIENFVKTKDDQVINIICEVCQKISLLAYPKYKE